MKSKLFSLICCILAVCALLAGCAKAPNGSTDTYRAWVEPSDSDISNSEPYAEYDMDPSNINAPAQIDATIDDESFRMTYVGSYGLPGRNINEYTNADGTLSVGYFADNGDLAQIIYSETTFPSIPDGITTETEYRKWVESYIASQTKDENLSKYTYSCSTTYMEYGEDYAESVTKDYFYSPAAASEHVYMYTFSYTTKFGGYNTYDEVSVIILPSGNAIFSQSGVFSISFNRHSFDDLSSVNINNETVNKTVEYQLYSALKSDEYDVKTFNIQKSTLFFENGTLYLTCFVNVELEYIGDELYEDEEGDEPVIIETMEYITMEIPEDCYK